MELNEPINVCCVCGKEVIGFLDEPDCDFICEDCIMEGN